MVGMMHKPPQMGPRRVCVLGAGVIGLSTAVCVQQMFPDVTVTLMAEEFGRQTTSDGAGGIFVPAADRIPGVPEHVIRKWCQEGFQHFHRLADSEDAYNTGCMRISGYDLYSQKPKEPLFKDIVYSCRELSSKEMERFKGKHRFGYFIDTVIVECRRYLPWLINKFLKAKGIVVKRKVQSFSELTDRYEVVLNCCGLGARTLVPDPDVYPLRGQVARVKAPWIKHFYRDLDTLASIIPGSDNVVVAGTRQEADEDRNVRYKDTESIFSRCTSLLPQLKGCILESEWVGMRPYRRKGIRLELENRGSNGMIVHNYGHGGTGVALSWGTAREAAALVGEALRESDKRPLLKAKI